MTDVRTDAAQVLPDIARDGRLRASVQRLLRDDYAVAPVMGGSIESDWPGDLVGRLLLSLSRLARAGAPTGERAHEIATALLAALEPRGYLGPVLAEPIDEQQVAGHGWVVAGLLQYAANGGDRDAERAALRVVDELILPALARFGDYPRDREPLPDAGGASGTASAVVGSWRVSTDVWCVLLTLNALVPAALEAGRTDLDGVIRELGGALADLDLRANHVQLHASLAAARNLADYGRAIGDRTLVGVARAVYDTYAEHARTLHYATFNWFGRPDSWTEPCAIVDSLGLARTLGDLLDDDGYREDARRIARSALDFAEREDGSFGLDTVATASRPELRPLEYDAHWCCTMRGAIGLLEAREGSVRVDRAGRTVLLDDPYPVTVDLGDACLVVRIDEERAQARVALTGTSVPGTSWSVRVTEGEAVPVPWRDEVAIPIRRRQERRDVGGGLVTEFGGAVILVDDEDAPGGLRPISDVAGAFGPGDAPRLRLARRI